MTSEEFVSLVRKMRKAQKEYFRARAIEALHESKFYEKRVDEELERMAAGAPPAPTQGSMFR